MASPAQLLLVQWTADINKGYIDRIVYDVVSTLRSHSSLLSTGGLTHGGGPSPVGPFLDAITSILTQSTANDASALRALAACIEACDAGTLLAHLQSWTPLLGDALRHAATAAAQTNGGGGDDDGDNDRSIHDSTAAAAAACGALAALFRRLGPLMELPGVRREATAGIGRVFQQLVPLLSVAPGTAAAAAAPAALALLDALLQAAPASARQQLPALAAALPELLCGGAAAAAAASTAGAEASARAAAAAAARCIASLPRVTGDATAWSDAARGLLASAHEALDFATMGLEPPPFDPVARELLFATAGGQRAQQQQQKQQRQGGGGNDAQRRSGVIGAFPWDASSSSGDKAQQQRAAGAVIGALLAGVEALATRPFPAPAPLPGRQLLALAARLVAVDPAAAIAAGAVAPSASRLRELALQAPSLRVAGWRLLRLLVAAARGQLLPLQGAATRVAAGGLRGLRLGGAAALVATPPAEREAIYLAAADLLREGGIAAARALCGDAIGAVLVELYGSGGAGAGGWHDASSGPSEQRRPSKRARGGGGGNLSDLGAFDPAAAAAAGRADAGARLAASAPGDLSAQAAALAMLGALLAAGGAALPADVRAHADAIAFHVARSSAAAAARVSRDPATAGGARAPARGVAAVRRAACAALLASLLAPGARRHAYITPALQLLADGRGDAADAQLRAVCAGAASALEALLHPRGAPLGAAAAGALAGARDPGLNAGGAGCGSIAVPPLGRPRMWSAVDAELAAAVVPAAADAAGDNSDADGDDLPVREGAGQQQQQQQAPPAQQKQQQQQQKQKQQQHANGTAGGARAAGGSNKRKASDEKQQRAKQNELPAPAAAPAAPKAPEQPKQQQQQQQQPPQPPQVPAHHAPATAAAPPAQPAAVGRLAAAAAAESSEDSEGSLPGIDSGDESS